MTIITLQRDKCIGCNYCAEMAPEYFRMSKRDGKSTLLKSVEKKGFHTARLLNAEQQLIEETCKLCPVKIIKATFLEG
jgi:ferredoxin